MTPFPAFPREELDELRYDRAAASWTMAEIRAVRRKLHELEEAVIHMKQGGSDVTGLRACLEDFSTALLQIEGAAQEKIDAYVEAIS